jgi:hypothetical protein
MRRFSLLTLWVTVFFMFGPPRWISSFQYLLVRAFSAVFLDTGCLYSQCFHYLVVSALNSRYCQEIKGAGGGKRGQEGGKLGYDKEVAASGYFT